MGVLNPEVAAEGRRTELQIALDRLPLDSAVRLAGDVAGTCDWLEVGTSLIKRYGMQAIEAISAAVSGPRILADLKSVDDVSHEFCMAYAAGASSATVVALAGDAAIDRAVATAREAGHECMVDLMGLPADQRAVLVERVEDDAVIFAVHIGKDAQTRGVMLDDRVGDWAWTRRVALAGGLDIAKVTAMPCYPRMRIIVGSAVTGATNPVLTARAIYEICRREVAPS
jgi:3-hexulose-6-phosphate synthase